MRKLSDRKIRGLLGKRSGRCRDQLRSVPCKFKHLHLWEHCRSVRVFSVAYPDVWIQDRRSDDSHCPACSILCVFAGTRAHALIERLDTRVWRVVCDAKRRLSFGRAGGHACICGRQRQFLLVLSCPSLTPHPLSLTWLAEIFSAFLSFCINPLTQGRNSIPVGHCRVSSAITALRSTCGIGHRKWQALSSSNCC